MDAKPLAWVGSSLDDLRSLPAAVRRGFGYDLHRLQLGLPPRDFKPLPQVGPGTIEVRVRVEGAFRAVVVTKYANSIYVLHVFQKKSRRTSRLDLELARARYQALVRARK